MVLLTAVTLVPLPAVLVSILFLPFEVVLAAEAAHQSVTKGVKFELVLVGDGEVRKQIEEPIQRYQHSDHGTVTGWISSEAVRGQLFGAHDSVTELRGITCSCAYGSNSCRQPVITTHNDDDGFYDGS